ncbi:hypothetical protein PtB15_4B749 [Puccinia triticina]|nr:hypothetical protein PtB15_4B749 [Puccinia triticina]
MNEELLRRFEESIASNQHRLNQIKNQLITRQPISGEDEHFFEHFAATINNKRKSIYPPAAAASTHTHLSPTGILEGGLDHGSPKKPRIPQEPEGRAHPPTAPNRSLSLGDLHGFRGSRRELATPAQKQEILAWHHAHGSNQTQTARHFDQRYPSLKLSQPLISGWLKGSRQQKTKHVQVTEALEKWCHQAVRDRLDLNGDVIREKWREFARFYQIPPASWLKLSEGWLSSFKERNGLKGFKRAGAHTNPPASAARKTAARAPPKAKLFHNTQILIINISSSNNSLNININILNINSSNINILNINSSNINSSNINILNINSSNKLSINSSNNLSINSNNNPSSNNLSNINININNLTSVSPAA